MFDNKQILVKFIICDSSHMFAIGPVGLELPHNIDIFRLFHPGYIFDGSKNSVKKAYRCIIWWRLNVAYFTFQTIFSQNVDLVVKYASIVQI